jgi:YD repeat-containing protein
LNQPTQITVTNTAPSVPTITRTVSFPSPDYVHCRETQKVTEPGSSTYAVTQVFGYDGFGNVSDVTVTGAGMAARNTHTDWGTTGQFPQSVRNPLSQTTQYGYDFGLGVTTSAQDPNGVSTSLQWQYDGFGRKTREIRPDGTATGWVYNDFATWGGCLIGSHAQALVQTIYNADQSVLSDGTTDFDTLDRPLIVNQRLLASGTYDSGVWLNAERNLLESHG